MAQARSVVTPGNFDGVHRGHRALVDAAVCRAQSHEVQSVAMFFEPHPIAFFRPERAPPMLTTGARRAELLKQAGIDRVDRRSFDGDFAKLTPEAFVRDVLVGDHAACGVVVGPDFRFGRGRAGNFGLLGALGAEHGFEVEVVPFVHLDDEEGGVVSSTRVRESVAAGDVALAASLLGRAHDVEGTVVRGDQRGRTIGFPTANLDCDAVLLPADGVYAVWVRVDATHVLPGVANLGVRPTFAAGRSVEVHLVDFEGDLYGRRVRVAFVARLRGERRFDGIDALKQQLQRDVQAGCVALDGAPKEWLAWI